MDKHTRQTAIIKRLKDLLIQQHEYFHRFLAVLEKQQALVKSGSAEELLAYIEQEEQIAAGIESIQKVIEPLEAMYHDSAPNDEIPALKAGLEVIRNQALALFSRNRESLSVRMAEIRAEITALRNNPITAHARRSMYHNSGAASLIDIQG